MPSKNLFSFALIATSLLEPSIAWSLPDLNPLNYIDSLHAALEVRSPQILGGGHGSGLGLLSSVVGDVTSLAEHHHHHETTTKTHHLTTTKSRTSPKPPPTTTKETSQDPSAHKHASNPLGSLLSVVKSDVHSVAGGLTTHPHPTPVPSASGTSSLPTASEDRSPHATSHKDPLKSIISPIKSIVKSELSQVSSILLTRHKSHGILPTIPVISGVSSLLNTILPTPVKSVVSVVETLVSHEVSGVKSVVTAAPSEIKSIISHQVSVVKSVVSAVPSDVKSILSSEVSVLKSVVTAAPSEIKSIISSEISVLKSVESVVPSKVKSIISAVPSDVKSILSSEISVLKSVVTAAPSEIKSILSSDISVIKSIATAAPSEVKSILSSEVSVLKSVVTAAPSEIKSILSSDISVIKSVVTGAPSEIKSILSSEISVIQHTSLPPIVSIVSSILPTIRLPSGPVSLPSIPSIPVSLPHQSSLPPPPASSTHIQSVVPTQSIPVPATSAGSVIGTVPQPSGNVSPTTATLPVFSASLPVSLTSHQQSPVGTFGTAKTGDPSVFSLASPSLPASIIVETSRTASPIASGTGLPSSMPQIIQPPGGITAQPSNTTLVQIAFGYSLNYPFVANTPASANQIFGYLPQGIAWGLGLDIKDVTMHSLQPYDTSGSLGYITTLAMAYVPNNLVNVLQLDLHTAVSKIYQNPSKPIWTLMNMVNPSFPILAGESVGSGGFGNSGTFNNAGPNTSSDGSPVGAGVSGPVRGTSVAIGVGVVAGAAAYGAAMFWIARRYRKRRQHLIERSPSMAETGYYTSGGYGYGSMMGTGAIMSGGRNGYASINNDERNSAGSGFSSNGRSVREVGISAPIVAENSLGWH